jgi:hypothetical protein
LRGESNYGVPVEVGTRDIEAFRIGVSPSRKLFHAPVALNG